MSTVDLRSIGRTYYGLRGLLLMPLGFLLIASGLFNSPPMGAEPVGGGAPYFLGAVVLAGIGYVVGHRYYRSNFGRVELTTRMQIRVAIVTAVSAILMAIAITVDFNGDLPVSLYGASFALSLLAHYRLTASLHSHHWAILGGLTVLSLAPVWGSAEDPVSVAMIPMGVACLAVGWFDHRELVRSFAQLGGADVTA